MNKIKCLAIGLGVCLIGLSPLHSSAQSAAPEYQNRIRVAYGDGLYTAFSLAIYEGLIGGGTLLDMNSSGTFSLGYRHISDNGRWGFGGDFAYFHATQTVRIGTTESKSDASFMMVMPAIDCYYLKSGLVRLYGTANAGVLFGVGGGDSEAGFAFQINPLALRVGSDRIAGFAEVGYGFKGLFNLGLEIGF